MNTPYNVFLYIYAPWYVITKEAYVVFVCEDLLHVLRLFCDRCAYCKAFDAVYKSLASVYKGDSTVLIARIDGTKNEIDHDRVLVRGFPTIYFFTPNAKDDPIEYDGDRTVQKVQEFIAAHKRTVSNATATTYV